MRAHRQAHGGVTRRGVPVLIVAAALAAACSGERRDATRPADTSMSFASALALTRSAPGPCSDQPDCDCARVDSGASSAPRFASIRICADGRGGAASLATFRGDGSQVDFCTLHERRLHGVCRSYFPDGTLQATARYANGCLNGWRTTFHANGWPEWRSQYRDGEPDGRWVRKSVDGQVLTVLDWEGDLGLLVETGGRSEANAPMLTGCLGPVF